MLVGPNGCVVVRGRLCIVMAGAAAARAGADIMSIARLMGKHAPGNPIVSCNRTDVGIHIGVMIASRLPSVGTCTSAVQALVVGGIRSIYRMMTTVDIRGGRGGMIGMGL